MGFIEQIFINIHNALDAIMQVITNAFTSGYESILTFYDLLVEQDEYMNGVILSVQTTSSYDGVNLVKYIGAFRFLVGDPVFFAIYILILVSVSFIIYKLVYMIYQMLSKAVSFITLKFG